VLKSVEHDMVLTNRVSGASRVGKFCVLLLLSSHT